MKPLHKIDFKPYVVVASAKGQTGLVLYAYGECFSCTRKVFHGRAQPGEQWIPIERVSDLPPKYELHKCDAEVARNPALRRELKGEAMKGISIEAN